MPSFFNPFRRDCREQQDMNTLHNPSNPIQAEPQLPAREPADDRTQAPADGVPGTIQQLLAIQEVQPSSHGPVAKTDGESKKVQAVLEQVMALSTSPWEDQEIAIALICRLEALHQGVVNDLHCDFNASHQLISRWSVDTDRLMHARNMLSNVDLG
jgi:hypothetical protein